MRQIRMLRAMRRELETGLRRLLHGHEGGNLGHSQGAAYGLPRQFPTLPAFVKVRVYSASLLKVTTRWQSGRLCQFPAASFQDAFVATERVTTRVPFGV